MQRYGQKKDILRTFSLTKKVKLRKNSKRNLFLKKGGNICVYYMKTKDEKFEIQNLYCDRLMIRVTHF